MVMSAEPFQAAEAAKATQTCALMYISLGNSTGEDSMFWRVKPKLHIFQELSEFQTWTIGNPSIFGATQMSPLLGSSRKSHVRAGAKTMCPRLRCALCKGTEP